MNLKGCFSKNTDDWRTPSSLYKLFIDQGYIDCFPFHADYDEFERIYDNKLLFVNPPYSKLKLIPDWLKTQLDHGCYITLLIPSRTDTKYFHQLLDLHPFIQFIPGRLHFNDSKEAAPFPSLLLTFIPGGSDHVWYH